MKKFCGLTSMSMQLWNRLRTDKEIWDYFTKKEEYEPNSLDEYDRFCYSSSKHVKVFEPEVSKHLIKNGLKVQYPDNLKFGVCLTHDVDIIYYPLFTLFYFLYKFKIRSAFRVFQGKISKQKNEYRNFRRIMDLEAKYNSKSSFYFLSLQKDDPEYNFDVTTLEEDFLEMIDRGWEIGLHGGMDSFLNFDTLMKEKKRLENVTKKPIIGYRNHFLRFKVPDAWVILEKAGFKYDTTFGYADSVGFRNGMCHPFKPFNLLTQKYIEIWEFPLTIMDVTVLKYMGLNLEEIWKTIKRLIDQVVKYEGIITILWHNTNLTSLEPELLKLYEKILQYCQKKKGWMTSGEEIYNYISKGNYFV